MRKARKEGDRVKKTEKAEQAASNREYLRLFPGFRASGRARKAVETCRQELEPC